MTTSNAAPGPIGDGVLHGADAAPPVEAAFGRWGQVVRRKSAVSAPKIVDKHATRC
jgi:hypothetical protein